MHEHMPKVTGYLRQPRSRAQIASAIASGLITQDQKTPDLSLRVSDHGLRRHSWELKYANGHDAAGNGCAAGGPH